MSRVSLEKKTQGDIEQEHAERSLRKSFMFGALYGSQTSLENLKKMRMKECTSNTERLSALTDNDFLMHECIAHSTQLVRPQNKPDEL
jgi:hypothetical protein